MPNVWNAWCVTLRQYQDLNAERMILKSLLTAVVLSTGILLSANFVLGPTKKIVTNSAREQVSTLMIAPFSLGNTAAAATLVTRLPEDSFNYRTPTVKTGEFFVLSTKVIWNDLIVTALQSIGEL